MRRLRYTGYMLALCLTILAGATTSASANTMAVPDISEIASAAVSSGLPVITIAEPRPPGARRANRAQRRANRQVRRTARSAHRPGYNARRAKPRAQRANRNARRANRNARRANRNARRANRSARRANRNANREVRRARRQARREARRQQVRRENRRANRQARRERREVRRQRRLNRQAALHDERRYARKHKHGKHHRKHRKRRRGSIHVYYYGLYPSYRPYYYGAGYPDPYYYDPGYDDDYVLVEPGDEKLTCKEAREILYDYGYTRVRSYDCKGTVYGFYVRNRGRSYKVRISADTADVLSMKRI